MTTMPILSLGPLELRCYSGSTRCLGDNGEPSPRLHNWSDVELAFVTSRTRAGFSNRETCVRMSFKSEHLIEAIGEDNPDDVVTINGTTYHGKVVAGADGLVHSLTAQQVSIRAEYLMALRESRKLARRAAQLANDGGLHPA